MASSIAACISSTVISVFVLVFFASAVSVSSFLLSVAASVAVLTSLAVSVPEVEAVL